MKRLIIIIGILSMTSIKSNRISHNTTNGIDCDFEEGYCGYKMEDGTEAFDLRNKSSENQNDLNVLWTMTGSQQKEWLNAVVELPKGEYEVKF